MIIDKPRPYDNGRWYAKEQIKYLKKRGVYHIYSPHARLWRLGKRLKRRLLTWWHWRKK